MCHGLLATVSTPSRLATPHSRCHQSAGPPPPAAIIILRAPRVVSTGTPTLSTPTPSSAPRVGYPSSCRALSRTPLSASPASRLSSSVPPPVYSGPRLRGHHRLPPVQPPGRLRPSHCRRTGGPSPSRPVAAAIPWLDAVGCPTPQGEIAPSPSLCACHSSSSIHAASHPSMKKRNIESQMRD